MSKSHSLSAEIYGDASFARQYARNIIDNAWNAFYERPASLSLLPTDLTNRSVLDAGCGPGITSEYFVKQGAKVTGLDYSKEMLKIAQENTRGEIRLCYHDLNYKMDMFRSSEFDIIYSSLVIHYIEDLKALFSEFSRILRPGGILVFSTDHPAGQELNNTKISDQEIRSVFWEGYDLRMHLYVRPWSSITTSLEENGLKIEKTITPVPLEECRLRYPAEYKQLLACPGFICIRAINIKSGS